MTTSHRSVATPEEPDYRYTLANERTFLAWVRTSITVLAGAVGFVQLGWDLGPRRLRLASAMLLALLGLGTAITSLVRWHRTDAAIRSGQALPRARAPWLIGFGMIAAAVLLSVLIGTRFADR